MTKTNPLTAHVHDAGFTDKSYERSSTHAEKWARDRAIRESQRNPESKAEPDIQPPEETVDEWLRMIALHLCLANFEGAHRAIEGIRRRWDNEKLGASALASEPLAQRLATHVTRLGLDSRTVHQIENVCPGTVGALLDAFPLAFVGEPNVGPVTISKIAEALLRAQVIDAETAQRAIEWYADEKSSRETARDLKTRAKSTQA